MEKVDYAEFKKQVDLVNELKEKFAELSGAIAEPAEIDYKAETFKIQKQLALHRAGMDLEKAEKYAKHINGESEDEIARQAAEIVMDLEAARGVKGADPSVSTKSKWNPFK